MAIAQKVTLTSDRIATVAALNMAVGTVTALPNTYLAAPIDLGDSLVITSSSLPTPNAYTGLTFDSITNAQLSQDLAGVGAFMTGLAADTGLRWVIQTRFGYALVVKGQPVGQQVALEMSFANPGVSGSLSNTILIGGTTTGVGGGPDFLYNGFVQSAGYAWVLIPFRVFLTQGAPGFQAGQRVTASVRISNFDTPGIFQPKAYFVQGYPLVTGQNLAYLPQVSIPVQVGASGLVNVEIEITVGIVVAGANMEAGVEYEDAYYGVRTVAT
jgi:hypothetical protein